LIEVSGKEVPQIQWGCRKEKHKANLLMAKRKKHNPERFIQFQFELLVNRTKTNNNIIRGRRRSASTIRSATLKGNGGG